MTPLFVHGLGAVTAAGLSHPQSAASFIAGVAGFEEIMAPDQFGEMQIAARVPANWRLRKNDGEWLVNLAARAGSEAMSDAGVTPERTVVICGGPSSERAHNCWTHMAPKSFADALATRLGGNFQSPPRLIDGGPAALIGSLTDAQKLLKAGSVDHILLIGVDTLLNEDDMSRLRAGTRLHGQSAQGLVPGEGAGAVVLSPQKGPGMAIYQIGLGQEPDTVLGERQSQGRGMQKALTAACAQKSHPEEDINFVVSNLNGERYGALEALVFRARFYQTHRDYMATAYPAMSFGDTGSASGVLALVTAAEAFRKGYAPGPNCMLELASENGLRTAAYLSGQDHAG